MAGQSGPILRTFRGDFGPGCWTGRVDLEGDRVAYRGLHCGQGVWLGAVFTIAADGFNLEIEQQAERELPVIETEAWRLAWNYRNAMK
jgi:hypothetical protein